MSWGPTQGQKSEWALLRRHQEEDVFGVQLAGNNSGTMARAAELLRDIDVDFVDINVSVPSRIGFRDVLPPSLCARALTIRVVTTLHLRSLAARSI